eukprot:11218884-Lingulodinium_polyedra.AAC.1
MSRTEEWRMDSSSSRPTSTSRSTAHFLVWLVEFVVDLATKYLAGSDGKTFVERLFGKKCREECLEFGEVVLWRKP